MIEEYITVASTIHTDIWQQLFGMPPSGIVVIIDPQVGQSGGQLRSLPLLAALGLQRFTYTSNWRGVELTSHEFVLINEATRPEDLDLGSPVCQIVSQEIELHSPSQATRKLLQAYRAQGLSAPLVYVFDSERFYLHDSSVDKSFMEEFEILSCYPYARIFDRYLELLAENDQRLSADRSMNLLLHRTLRVHALPAHRLRDLFSFRDIPPESPAWDILMQCARIPGVRRDDMIIHYALRPWVESDITRVATSILENLQRFDYDPERIETYRAKLRGAT